jgi:hypothetical protein
MWLLAQTYAAHEFETQQSLDRDRLETYVPTFRRTIKPRHVRSSRTVTYPLLPRYLFVSTPDLPHVLDVIRNHNLVWPVRSGHGSFLFVPDTDVSSLQARQAAGEFDQLIAAQKFPVGCHVSFTVAGTVLTGSVIRILNRNQVRVDVGNLSMTVSLGLLRYA